MIQFITLLFAAFSLHAQAIEVSNVAFYATKTCPTYWSPQQQNNPQAVYIHPDTMYSVEEINKPYPDWLRIKLKHDNSLRWVTSDCGRIQKTNRAMSLCDNAGMADSYVLALSSQPGFCETYGYEAGKPECRKLAKNSYQANHLTLHGLWPNMAACGQHYGFCGIKPKANHCSYAPLPLSPHVRVELERLMPSFFYGSCLERHEWNKHGSCQILSADDYFSLAMRLATETDRSPFGAYLTQKQGKTVKLSELRAVINQTFGSANGGKIDLSCKNGILVDIYIHLPALLPSTDSLFTLVNQAPAHHSRDTCGSKVTISHFSKDTWL